AGNDTLDGSLGADTLVGGAGNDLYIVANAFAGWKKTGTGIDTVKSSVSFDLGGSTVSGDVENLTLTGPAPINGIGNELGNVLIGNAASNRLIGNAGNDTIDGGVGNDTLTGGAGSDTFVRHSLASEGRDTISDFQTGRAGDTLDIHDLVTGFNSATSNVNDFVHIAKQKQGNSTVVQVDPDGPAGGHHFTTVAVLAGVPNTTVDQL